jgi:hypothetical protein
MVSHRKRHRDPVAQDQRPEPSSQAPVVDDPVGDAERAALRARIGELESAETLAKQRQQPPAQQLPAHVLEWVKGHPE